MSRCPECNVQISDEIEQFGGECPNCFAFLDGSLGENDEFEPTGMFTKEQLAAFMKNEQSDQPADDLVEDLLTDEVDLDDVLAFEDDVTEILEPTEPIVSDNSKQTAEFVTNVEEDHEDDGFNFEDEPTVALYPKSVLPPESNNTDPTDGSSKTEQPSVKLNLSKPAFKFGSDSEPQSTSKNYVLEDEASEEESFGEDTLDEFGIGGESLPIEQHANPLHISPKTEGVERRRERTPKTQKEQKSFHWKPLVATLLLVGVAAAVLLPKEESVQSVKNTADHEISVAKVEAGALKPDEPEKKKSVKKIQKKTQKRKKVATPKPVEKSGVRTFQTAAPTTYGTAGPSQNLATGKSAKLEKDVNKLKKSLKYCHTKALKTDPNVSGKWEVQFKVSSGKATGVRVKAMRSASSEIESCMKTKIKRFSFSDNNTVQNFKFRVLFER